MSKHESNKGKRENGDVSLTKKLIFSSAEFPSISEFYINIALGLTANITDFATVDLALKAGYVKVTVNSTVSFAYSLIIANNTCHNIEVTSVNDSMLTVSNLYFNPNSFINWALPAFSERDVRFNDAFRRTGELIRCDDPIDICPGKIGIITIRGSVNSANLTLDNFAVMKYRLCDSDREHVVFSNDAPLALVNTATVPQIPQVITNTNT
jgi:hypothetical protein